MILLFFSCQNQKHYPYVLKHGEIDFYSETYQSFIDDLDNNAHSEFINVQMDTTNLQFKYRIVIHDLESEFILHSEPIWAELEDLKAYDLTGNGRKEIIYTYQQGDSLLIKVYDPFSTGNVLFHELVVAGQRRFKERPYHAHSVIENIADLNHDGHPEILLVVEAFYDKYPRGIFVYDFHNRKFLWKYLTGLLLDQVQIRDLNSDGHLEIFFNTRAPGNDVYSNNTDDHHTYFIVLDEDGKLIYQETLGGENTVTRVLFAQFGSNQPETFITLTASSNYKTYEDTRLIKWGLKPGLRFFHEIENANLRLKNYFYQLPFKGNPHLFAVNAEDQIYIIDSSLNLVKTLPYKEKFSTFLGNYDLTMDGKKEFVWSTFDKYAVVFNSDFEIIYRLPHLYKLFEIEQGRNRPVRPAVLLANGELFDFSLQKITFLDRILQNKNFIGITLLVIVNILLWMWLIARTGNWRWYRKQLQYFDDSLSVVMVLDAKGRIVACNKRCEDLIEKDPGEIRNKSVKEIFAHHLKPICEWIIDQYQAKNNGQNRFALKKDDTEQTFNAYLQFIRSRLGRLEGAALILNDITAFVQSQRTASWIAVAQKLAHEIKNPLTAVRLSLQRMKMEYENDPALQKRLEELVEGSLEEAGRMRKVVDDFMRFSKIDTPRLEPVRIEEIVKNLIDRFELLVPEQLTIKMQIQDGLPAVIVDESYLSTALSNVIDNAIAAITPPGEINIQVNTLENIKEDVQQPLERLLEIEITDTGQGIEEDKLTEIFQPFYTTKEGGSGLGLVIARRIIEDHGGKIQIFSRKGLGTKVTIHLPVSYKRGT